MSRKHLLNALCWLSLPLLACLGMGCDSQLGDAFKSFSDFSSGNNPDPHGNRQAKGDWKQRRWLDKSKDGRSRAVADIEVRSDISKQDLEKLLRDACHHNDLQRSSSVIKVRAWPGSLEQLAAPLGISVFARDGHGWDGKGVGFEKIQIFMPTAEPPRPSKAQHAMAESVQLRMGTGEVLTDAIASAAKRMGVDADDVRKAVSSIQVYYDAVRNRMPPEEQIKKK